MDDEMVLYVYRCTACGHSGNTHLAGDDHDTEQSLCKVCGAAVRLEWDGGVTFDNVSPRSDT